MNIIDLELDETFKRCFISTAGPVVECNCGREHVCITSSYLIDGESDESNAALIANYTKRAETDDTLVLNYEWDLIDEIHIGGGVFAECCECNGWEPYMKFILTHRSEVKNFLIRVADAATRALEHEKTFNVLKNKELKVIDRR